MKGSATKSTEARLARSKSYSARGEYTLALVTLTESADHPSTGVSTPEGGELALEFRVQEMFCHASLLHSEDSENLAISISHSVPPDSVVARGYV